MRFDRNFRSDFWKRVDKAGDCWIWTRSLTPAGYGQLQSRSISPHPMLAHRVAWELERGPIPDGMHVLHRCDNPPCVNPGHLFLGTQKDNNLDRQKKGRTASGDRNGARTKRHRNPFVRNGGSGLRGEKHPMSKLTDEQVRQLQRDFLAGENRRHIAKRYGVSEGHVYCLGRRAL